MTPYYQRDGIAIYHGDCRVARAWLEASVMVTDPPYGMSYRSGWSGSSVANDGNTSARDGALWLWGDKPAIVFGRWSVPHPSEVKITLTWDKGDWPGMGDLELPWGPSTEEVYVLGAGFVGKRSGSVIRCDRMAASDMQHPTEKPVELIRKIMAKCPPGDIADPFMGSGAVLVAARDMGRRAIGIEIEEKYCEIAAKRLSQGVLELGA